jgi:hypothetical protein
MGSRFVEVGLEDVSVEERTSIDDVMGLRSWARTASDRSMMSEDDVARWEMLYGQVVAEGEFLWSVSFFITSGRKQVVAPI